MYIVRNGHIIFKRAYRWKLPDLEAYFVFTGNCAARQLYVTVPVSTPHHTAMGLLTVVIVAARES